MLGFIGLCLIWVFWIILFRWVWFILVGGVVGILGLGEELLRGEGCGFVFILGGRFWECIFCMLGFVGRFLCWLGIIFGIDCSGEIRLCFELGGMLGGIWSGVIGRGGRGFLVLGFLEGCLGVGFFGGFWWGLILNGIL